MIPTINVQIKAPLNYGILAIIQIRKVILLLSKVQGQRKVEWVLMKLKGFVLHRKVIGVVSSNSS